MSHVFLNLDEIISIHRDQIERYGGTLGIRDMGLLQSAAAQPMAAFGGQFLHEDLYAMASAYLFHLTQNHPFLDGNKRVGAVAAYMFLAYNNIELQVDEEEYEALVMGVAKGEVDKTAIAQFFRDHT